MYIAVLGKGDIQYTLCKRVCVMGVIIMYDGCYHNV